MEVRVLGCSGSPVPGQLTSCLLLDGQVLLDAGGVTARLSVEEQLAIDHVLVSHAHLDHVYDLAFLADNVMAQRSAPLQVWAPQEVLDVLKKNLFNDQLWPDLTQLKLHDFPVLEFCPLSKGGVTQVGGLEVSWARTEHPVFSAGYLVASQSAVILYSGDTTSTHELWALGNRAGALSALFVETSFPNRLEELAIKTGHLSPGLLEKELEKLDKPELPVKIFHMKPQYLEEISKELVFCRTRCQILQGDERFVF